MELTPDAINAKIGELNVRQVVLNETVQRTRAEFESVRQSFAQQMQTIQTEFVKNVGAIEILQTLLPHDEAEKVDEKVEEG